MYVGVCGRMWGGVCEPNHMSCGMTEPSHVQPKYNGSRVFTWFSRNTRNPCALHIDLIHEIAKSGFKEMLWLRINIMVHGSRPFGTAPEGGVCHIRPHTPTYAPHTPTYVHIHPHTSHIRAPHTWRWAHFENMSWFTHTRPHTSTYTPHTPTYIGWAIFLCVLCFVWFGGGCMWGSVV